MSSRTLDIRSDLFDELFISMTVEIGLFSRFSVLLTELSAVVREKNWPHLELLVEKLNKTGDEIVETEKKRNSIFEELKKKVGVPDDCRLIDLLPVIDVNKGNELSNLTKQLRMEVLKVKVTARGLSYFLQSVSHLLKNVFDEIFPHTRGKIYSRSGKENATNDGAIMINRKL
jgi:hypothetical protein